MKILEELWNGNILPYEQEATPKSRLRHIGRLIVRNEEELDPLLSEKAKEVFEKLKENEADRTRLSECEIVFLCQNTGILSSDLSRFARRQRGSRRRGRQPQNMAYITSEL